MLKARGEDFFERIVDNLYDQAQYLVNLVSDNSQKNKQNLNYYVLYNKCQIRSTDGFRLAFEGDFGPDGFDRGAHGSNVCFEYIPPSMRGQEETEEWKERLGTVAPR